MEHSAWLLDHNDNQTHDNVHMLACGNS